MVRISLWQSECLTFRWPVGGFVDDNDDGSDDSGDSDDSPVSCATPHRDCCSEPRLLPSHVVGQTLRLAQSDRDWERRVNGSERVANRAR